MPTRPTSDLFGFTLLNPSLVHAVSVVLLFQRAFNLCLFLYMFCALWGYGAVFGQSLATYAPVPYLGEKGAYRLYVVLFSCIVVPMSTLDIKEQAVFQVGLSRESSLLSG